MRKAVFAAASLALVAGTVAPGAAHAGGSGADQIGSFSAPFREDAFARPDDGCVTNGDGTKDCLPAAASMVQLADGRVLYWNALEGSEDIKDNTTLEAGGQIRNDRTRVLTFNPADPTSASWAEPTPADGGGTNDDPDRLLFTGDDGDNPASDSSLFCADQKILADGRVLTVGGTDYYQDPYLVDRYGIAELEGTKSVRMFEPTGHAEGEGGKWVQKADMNYGRWYPSMVTQADGNLFVASGVTKLIKPIYQSRPQDSGTNVVQTETYDVGADAFTVNEGGNKSLPLFPRLHLLPNGKVYYDAAGQAYNPSGQSYDEALWNLASVYDPTASGAKWTDLGVPGAGTLEAGFRGSTFSAMLPLKPPYDSASFLSAGGVLGTTPGSYVATDHSRINKVSITPGGERLETFTTGRLNTPRWYSTGVPLPDGSVMAFSGADLDEVVSPGSGAPIRRAERFVPNADGTGGSWVPMAEAARGRTYHNNAILLPDGRVLVGGHAPIPNGYGKHQTNSATPVREYSNNFRDASLEVFSPPYMFRADRPTVTGVNDHVGWGELLTVSTPDSESIDSVVLVRNPAQTHLIDGDQRTVEVPIVARSEGQVHVAIPPSSAVLPPGPYMVFARHHAADGTIVPSTSAQTVVSGDSVVTGAVATATSSPLPALPIGVDGTSPAPEVPAVRPADAIGESALHTRNASTRRTPPVSGPVTVAVGALLLAATAAGRAVRRKAMVTFR